jgi:hypothetical protein
MSLRAYVPTCDAIHYLRLLGADCSKFGRCNVIQYRTIVEGYNHLRYEIFCREKQIRGESRGRISRGCEQRRQ